MSIPSRTTAVLAAVLGAMRGRSRHSWQAPSILPKLSAIPATPVQLPAEGPSAITHSISGPDNPPN